MSYDIHGVHVEETLNLYTFFILLRWTYTFCFYIWSVGYLWNAIPPLILYCVVLDVFFTIPTFFCLYSFDLSSTKVLFLDLLLAASFRITRFAFQILLTYGLTAPTFRG